MQARKIASSIVYRRPFQTRDAEDRIDPRVSDKTACVGSFPWASLSPLQGEFFIRLENSMSSDSICLLPRGIFTLTRYLTFISRWVNGRNRVVQGNLNSDITRRSPLHHVAATLFRAFPTDGMIALNGCPADVLLQQHNTQPLFSVLLCMALLLLLLARLPADFEIFDEETSKKIHDEHEKDMENAAKAIGERIKGLGSR